MGDQRKRFSNKVALVTGSAQGIGFAAARQMLEEGATVVLNDVARDRLESAKQRLPRELRPRVRLVAANVLDSGEVAGLIDGIKAELGGPDVLVNNVGGRGTPPRFEANLREAERELDLCLTSAFMCTRAALPSMIAKGSGAIVNISSSAGKYTGDLGGVPYCAGKAGVLALTRAIASEYGKAGVRCNCVSPGMTLTEQGLIDWMALAESEKTRIASQISVGRLATPEDIAEAICFLASDDARYVNGVAIDVNGGHHMG
jgi:3-oxoacyl-[acyl-carrier protein] reductase